jgi:type IV pilus assembly protein PilX
MKPHTARRSSHHAQRGVVIIFGLIALVIMLIGAVAMVRSMNSSLANAGNLGFKRDLTNQGERAMAEVLAQMEGGALGTEVLRRNHLLARNYRATQFVGNQITAQGLPLALVSDAAFALVGTSARDIAIADMGVTVRYVVDRLCQDEGVAVAESCTMADSTVSNSANSSDPQTAEHGSEGGAGAVPQQVVYRLSIRVDGPRQTQAFFQTTFTL